jgi:hypothetical protein
MVEIGSAALERGTVGAAPGHRERPPQTGRADGAVPGQKGWKYDLYEGGTLKATYKRGVWTEHGEGKS